jgi:site-specific recombinase XerD
MFLSQEEVTRLIESALSPFHRTILVTLYATGVRRAELANLKTNDIDSQRMVIRVRGGKGRDAMLSPNLPDELQQHYRRLHRKPVPGLADPPEWYPNPITGTSPDELP